MEWLFIAYQSTGLVACCKRYGDFSPANLFNSLWLQLLVDISFKLELKVLVINFLHSSEDIKRCGLDCLFRDIETMKKWLG